ncbi:glycerophosphoryl diester phosphodiesterase membrane domain-containing protein [Candidatus Cyanaurora vandensis]|uniref:glycerophosphoryl diester phosphodiesterase membrane domain-containing protein n=1 Tax=Candidatus Cyanaurora vandensis TaxID=2714958 RepID=UPI00257C7012|nr:glycerophosphoryl diester phosphodiesterase membrane domain-containing protein [Candidatus Cyanaurora vandensis]
MSAVFQEGVRAFEEGNFGEARRLFELAVNDDPTELKIQVWLAHTHQKLEQLPEARRLYEQLANHEDPVLRRVALKGLSQCQAGAAWVTSPPPVSSRPRDRAPVPTRPRSAGDIVSAGVNAYRARFKEYVLLSGIAYLWLILGCTAGGIAAGIVLAVFGGAALGTAFMVNPTFSPVLFWLFPLALLLASVPSTFGFREFWLRQCAAHLVSFEELSNKDYSLKQAQVQMRTKSWTLVWASFLVGGLVFLPYIAVLVLSFIAILVVGLNGIMTTAPEQGIVFALIAVVLVIVGLVGTLYLSVRLQLALPVLAVEDLGVTAAVRRSWDLTQGRFWSTLGVTALLYLLTLAATLVPQLLAQSELPGLSVLGSLLVLALTIMALPVWWTTTTVLYYDLRARKEGLDLLQQLG